MSDTKPGILGRAKVLANRLKTMYSAQESENISRLLAESVSGRAWPQLLMDSQAQYPEALEKQVNELENRLLNGEPIQYVTGKTWFFGREFKVDKRVLIPRPETEELVLLAKKCLINLTSPRVLDVGTGSGCIAISLNLEIPGSEVWAMDISDAALQMASENAKRLGATVNFRKADALSDFNNQFPGLEGSLDAIISNPPYIPESEKQEMHGNVLDHEPHLALFVPDEDALRFYRAIAHEGKALLKKGGLILFEIHYNKVTAVTQLLKDLGYHNVVMIQDVFGRERMVMAQKIS